jgi:hypothetical protein
LDERILPAVTVTRTSDNMMFPSIQAAINDAGTVNGNTLVVSAGIDAENVAVTKSLTIKGNNAGINPNTMARNPETIVVPAINNINSGTIFTVTVSNVTIDGFTLDGNGGLAGGVSLNGVNSNAANAVSNGPSNTLISGLTVQNNIIQNLNLNGVVGDLTAVGNVTSGNNVISNNRFDNLPSLTSVGRGVLLVNNFYASVTGNVLTRVRTGIQTNNFYLANPGAAAQISNNSIQFYVRGIFHNLFYQNASTWSITGNNLTALPSASPFSGGLQIFDIQNAVSVIAQNNNVTGATYGVEFWNVPTTSTITVQGGTLTNNQIGVWATNNDNTFGAGGASVGVIDGVTVLGSTAQGVLVDDQPAGISTIGLTVQNSVVQDNPVGVQINGGRASAGLFRDTITGNGTDGVLVNPGGILLTATENFVTGNGVGIAVSAAAGSVPPIFDNDLSGNTTAIANGTAIALDAHGNWWGTTSAAGVAASVTGPVTTAPFLLTGADTQPGTPGFQGDYRFTLTTLTATPTTTNLGQAVTFSATLQVATSTAPTGTVDFRDGSTSLGTTSSISFVSVGLYRVTFTSSALTAGTHSQLRAVYSGDANYSSSTSANVTVTVIGPPPLPPPPPPTVIKYIAIGAGASGGPEVNVYNAATGQLVSSFFAFTPTFMGGVRVAVADLNGDGTPDIICAAGPGGGPQVEVIDGTKLNQLQANGQIANSAIIANFFAFTPSFAGGVFVGAAVSTSGQREIVVGADAGGGPQVEVIDATKIALQSNGQIANSALLTSIFAFTPSFAGGVRVALADVNGDGTLDVIASAGPGGGPQVIVVDGTKLTQLQTNGQIATAAVLSSFFAFTPTFSGGVFVSAGATQGTSRVNLILGAGAGGGPQVEIINGSLLTMLQTNGQIANAAVLSSFFARVANQQTGIPVGFTESYGSSGHPAILTGEGFGGGQQVIPFDSITGQALAPLIGSPFGFLGGLFVSG